MHIALIDDNPTTLSTYSVMLAKIGAIKSDDNFYSFSNPDVFYSHGLMLEEIYKQSLSHSKELLRLHKKPFGFDVVICDYDLGPEFINGFSLLFNLQDEGFQGLPILLTADNSKEMMHRVKHSPSIFYVFKGENADKKNPFDLIKELMENYRVKKIIPGVSSRHESNNFHNGNAERIH